MVNKLKKVVSILLTVLVLTGGITTLSQLCNLDTTVANAATTQSKTQNVISKATGKVIGTVTLSYKTEIEGGRPQFIYETCKITFNFKGYYRGNVTMTSYSGDCIQFQVDYNNLGIDAGYDILTFTP